ncbi:MAG: PAS domain-containing sensor histidine kinase [Tannerellaceae bacterium]|nr:PAS domain-containing sensor histidine kinase [Tannerellaceae bacterium]
MKIKGLFWLLTFMLLLLLAGLTWLVVRSASTTLFFIMEGVILITAVYLLVFYTKIIKPLKIIGDGMDLLKEQDFSSRLRSVGQPDADRIVEIFNKMMEQLKNEWLSLREQNQFMDLLITASPLGVVILNPDEKIISLNPAGVRMFHLSEGENYLYKNPQELSSVLAQELMNIPMYESKTIRLSDANIYKCIHSSFVDRGFHHPFYLIESLTEEVFKAEKKAYEKVIRMIAHEVNNTTAGITSTLDTIQAFFSLEEGMEDVCEVLKVSIERCYKMSHFITNFADVVRIPEPRLSVVELNHLVISCKRFMETLCANCSINLVLQTSVENPKALIDSVLFEQVLVNIIKNAVESIEQAGSIFITITSNPVCLEIADTGKGIDKETEAKLFTPFFSTKPQGQGIGLIFIREVLQLHNCSFSLHTGEDRITRFRILFRS